jgi:hypothetical protein
MTRISGSHAGSLGRTGELASVVKDLSKRAATSSRELSPRHSFQKPQLVKSENTKVAAVTATPSQRTVDFKSDGKRCKRFLMAGRSGRRRKAIIEDLTSLD